MKTLFLALIAAALSSCEVCETCTCTTKRDGTGTIISTTEQEVCGSNKEIRAMEKPVSATSNGIKVTTKCDCR